MGSITEESELGAGEMCLYYNAATKKCYMLVGPQCAGVEGANLFAMNEAGTDKVLFTNADQNEVGIYLNNVSTKYVVALPVKKDEMLVDIYNKGNIDQIESASKHNSVKFFKEKQYAIPGEYNTTLGYNFTNVPLSSLYDFKPADAEFIFTLDQNNQNDKTKEQWDGNFKWNATKGTLTLSNTYELANYNFLNQENFSNGDNCGIKFSWTFKAGEEAGQQAQSNGDERWFIKDPVRNPGTFLLYLCYDKQPCADGRILGTDGAVEHTPVDYALSVSALTGDPTKNKLSDLEEGKEYNFGLAFNNSFWRQGFPYDVCGGPTNSTKLPVLVQYSDAAKNLVITDHCKQYFCKNKAELKLFIENSETQDHFELIDENQFIVKIKKAIAPDEHGNLQFQVLFNTDYANQRWALMLLNNR